MFTAIRALAESVFHSLRKSSSASRRARSASNCSTAFLAFGQEDLEVGDLFPSGLDGYGHDVPFAGSSGVI
jgi:hypothetical protein